MKKKTLLSWSSGKDSAWALHRLLEDPDIDLAGLFCVTNGEFNRVTMHAVRVELLHRQAESIGLPLQVIEIPYPCSDTDYAKVMGNFTEKAKGDNITNIAFGDLFLEDVRNYRIEKLEGTGITPFFPLWNIPTDQLSIEMIDEGLKAVVTCVDPSQIPTTFIGREYDAAFLNDLPAEADPCGEHGEFHTFVTDGPMFKEPLDVSLGKTVTRNGFTYIDIVETAPQTNKE